MTQYYDMDSPGVLPLLRDTSMLVVATIHNSVPTEWTIAGRYPRPSTPNSVLPGHYCVGRFLSAAEAYEAQTELLTRRQSIRRLSGIE